MCVLNDLTNSNVLSHRGQSHSVLISSTLEDRQVVVKLAPRECDEDNSLHVERVLYSMVKDALAIHTPHLLPAITVDECDLNEVHSLPWEIMDQCLKIACSTTKFAFVITEEVRGWTLSEYVGKFENRIRSQNLEAQIALQVAQALCVCKMVGFQHNDLHGGNIRVREKTINYEYKVPFEFMFTTSAPIVILDYDLASARGLDNRKLHTFCPRSGACNAYVENWDWYMFLYFFVRLLARHKIATKLEALLPVELKVYRHNTIQHDALFGHACTCLEMEDEKKCARCEIKRETLRKMVSPEDFIRATLSAK